LRLTGLDRTIGRKPVTDAQIDALMWFVSGAVIIMGIYILLAEVLRSF
jgi:hypothetical protein